VALGRGQLDELRERVTDRLEVRIDGGRRRRAWRARQLAAERCADQAAYLFGRELRFGEEVAELRQRALPTKRRSFVLVSLFIPFDARTSGVISPPGTTPAWRSVRPVSYASETEPFVHWVMATMTTPRSHASRRADIRSLRCGAFPAPNVSRTTPRTGGARNA